MSLFPKRIFLAVMLCVLTSTPFAQTRPANPARGEILRDLDQAMDDVAQRILPSVVQISVSGFGPSHEQRGGESVIERQRGIG